MRARQILLTTTALVPLLVASAGAGPQGPSVVGGTATVQNPGTANVVVNQSSQRAVINWHMFNIGAGETTTFNTPGASAVTLNRVTGGMGPSQILGTLNSNGQVFIVNKDGFVFGAGAVVNTAGFLATTHDIKNEDFMAGRYNFNIPGRPDASIVNLGTITAHSGGFAALVAPGVRNAGTITATLGTVGLAASGGGFSLDLYGDKLITLGVNDQVASKVIDVATGQPLDSLVTNTGKLSANGGRVELTAAAARHVVDSVINTSGVVEANAIGTRGGQIILGAATAASKHAGAPKQTVKVSGKLSVAGKKPGEKGGKVVVTGEDIRVAGATIDASGSAGGGKVLIGGDWGGGHMTVPVNNQSAQLESGALPTATWVSVDAATTIDASATESGHGGKVILWSDERTSFTGRILALGGPAMGNGGFAEVSGHQLLEYGGAVDLRAANGTAGTLLLDPHDVVISSTASINGSWSGNTWVPSGASILSTTDLLNQLLLGNVIVTTNDSGVGTGLGDITVASSFTWSGNNSLSLIAHNNIYINANATIANTGAGSLTLRADSQGSGIPGTGRVILASNTNNTRIDWSNSSGKVEIFYSPWSSYATPTNFASGSNTGMSGTFGGQVVTGTSSSLTAYMLVNSVSDLQNINNNLGGTYALGKSINGGCSPCVPLGTFTGLFDGQNHLISNMTFAASGPGNHTGLFSTIGAAGTVRNLGLANITVAGNASVTSGDQYVGILAGRNFGAVQYVSTSGSVGGVSNSNILVGGLVGENWGQISNSNSAATVTLTNGGTAGGLVGRHAGGTITTSHATGNVNVSDSGLADIFAGGLVGDSSAAINGSSYATGNVTSNGGDPTIGGLVGALSSGGTIDDSHATGAVTATTSGLGYIGGLVGASQGVITDSHATGNVSLTNPLAGAAGGLVGWQLNGGSITNAYATGTVGGDAFTVGGLVGQNQGILSTTHATGAVGGTSVIMGGLVGLNEDAIYNSHATGTVTGGATTFQAGGFVGTNDAPGSIDSSYATGNVSTVNGIAGGFVALNMNSIENSRSSGAVSGGAGAMLGGFAGWNVEGTIEQSYSTSSVTGGVIGGGFVGLNFGNVDRSYATGAVSSFFAGGFVALNYEDIGLGVGTISRAYATGAVTASAGGVAGGFAGLNAGTLDQTYAAGLVTGGPGAFTGGLAALNGYVLPGSVTTPFTPVSTLGTATNSYWDTGTTGQSTSAGGVGLTTAQLTSALPAGFNGPVWDINPGTSYPFLDGLSTPTPTPGPQAPPPSTSHDHDTTHDPVVQPPVVLVSNDPTPQQPQDLINIVAPTPPAPPPSGGPPQQPRRVSGVPPRGETRFVNNEVVLQLSADVKPEQLAAVAKELGLVVIASESVGLLARTVYRFQITNGKSVTEIIRALETKNITAFAQPNYVYTLTQAAPETSAQETASVSHTHGDSEQYVIPKLRLQETHAIARGSNVLVAVIDSAIDPNHPDLKDAIAERFDAVDGEVKPHMHGTGMAGAIASQRRLLGVAPRSRLLAISAFGPKAQTAESTSMQIVKGLNWAVQKGAKVINMSFAGPHDPILAQAIKTMHDRGIVMIAAAGNAGPGSPPLFPAADPNVIAVTATDIQDKVFARANRGKYIAVAAPGVDVLVPAPEGSYQLTTGTSVAAAHISGVAALLLERNPALKPADIRKLLTSTARKSVGSRPEDIGSGLVDPYQALQRSGRSAATH